MAAVAGVHQLSHGRSLMVRPATVADVDGLIALYDDLDPDDRYRRFFSGFQPDRRFIERMTTAAERGGDELVAVVMERDGAPRIVGEAGYWLLSDGDGELAMVVARAWRGWLGPHLLDALVRRARARGIPNLRADVLATNAPMLHMLCARGWATVPDSDWSTVRVVVGTQGSTPRWPIRRVRPRVLVEVPGGRWRAGDAARKAGFDVLACAGPHGTPSRCPAIEGLRCPLVDGADVVVVPRVAADDLWSRLASARSATHRGVRVLVQPEGTSNDVVDAIRGALAEDGREPTT